MQNLTTILALALAELTTTVESPPTPYEPDGTCCGCRVITDNDSGGSTATLDVYFHDDGEDFIGDFELELLLDNNEHRHATIVDAFVADGSTESFVVTAGPDWDWNDVTHVWFEAVPG